jgi:hypothetical protein
MNLLLTINSFFYTPHTLALAHHPQSVGAQESSDHHIILVNIDFNSSSSGIIPSKITSLKSIDSSSIIKAGDSFIPSSVLIESSLVSFIFIKSINHNSSKTFFTLDINSLVFFQFK